MSDAEASSSLPAAPRRRARQWFQFRLRTLLAAVTVVAAAFWAIRAYVEPYRQQRRALEVVKELGGRAVTAEAGPWQQRLLGANLQNITLIDLADCHQVDEYLPHVASLPCLETLAVGGEEFTDDHLRRLRLPKLTGLVLDSTSVSVEALAAWQADHPAAEVYQSDRQFISLLPRPFPDRYYDQNRNNPSLEKLVGAEYFREVVGMTAGFNPLHLARIGKLRHLRGLEVVGDQYTTDADLASLQGVRQVTYLWLTSSRVSDAGLAHLATLSKLQALHLDDTQMSDDGLVYLASMSELEELYLGDTRITDAGLFHLRGLAKLRALKLDGTRLTDAGGAHLTSLKQLEELGLRATSVGDDGVEHLRGLTKLKRLDLSVTRVTDEGLTHLALLTALKSLDLAGTRVSDAGIARLETLASLEKLALDATEVSDAGLARCRSWPDLVRLGLGGTSVTDRGLLHLHALKRLEQVNLYGTRVSREGKTALRAALPKLE